MIAVNCRRCGDKFETTSVNQILCDDCQNLIKQCGEKHIFVVLKSEPTKCFRASRYLPETKTVMVEESDIVTNSVDLDFIIDVIVGCDKCDPTGSHTNKKAFLEPPNVMSPEDRLKHCSGFKFCPYCGREL